MFHGKVDLMKMTTGHAGVQTVESFVLYKDWNLDKEQMTLLSALLHGLWSSSLSQLFNGT
jgi:hypothetical protein